MSKIQFEGQSLNKDLVGKVWRNENSIFCLYRNKSLLLKSYEYADWAEYAFTYLLSKLGRIPRWP